MQTSLARRQRHRRALGRRPTGRRGTTVATVLGAALASVLIGSFIAAFVGFAVVVGAYNQYAVGLPEPAAELKAIDFEQQTIVYDRTGKIELARLGEFKRELVEFEEIPGEVLDATTAIEDKDFWTNPGFDFFAILDAGIDTVSGRPRGASTITQQLVRQRLLRPEDFEGSTYDRKIREIIQSIKLTEAFPGEEGKEDIITAYLNQNFYGNQSYGVKAAAKSYFGKPLEELTLAQVAILAAIPQSPTRFDLVRNAERECLEDVAEGVECNKFKLVVPPETEIVQRRDYILDLMKTRSPLSGDRHTLAEYEAAKDEPVELVEQVSVRWRAPHFVWQVRHELGMIFCPDTPDDCQEVDSGGYKVITTLDWNMQKVAEKWTYVAARAPNAKDPRVVMDARDIPESQQGWVVGLSGHNINNAASAVMDYRTGEVLAYVGSASYTARGTETFQPQFDVLADGWRQPGSAIKPIGYAIGIDDKAITASTMLMDVVTDFGNDYTPTQADKLERGPVRVRSALQFSLNIPAIKSSMIAGLERVFARSKDFGLTYPNTAIPVVSMGIGTLEVHPIDLLGAYGTIANGGVRAPRQVIDSVVDVGGNTVWPISDLAQTGIRVIDDGTAYIITDILAGNTETRVNPYWGKWAIYDGDTRRPAAYKTGTTSDNRDVAAYGYLAPPEDAESPALVVGVWMGNSDNSPNDGKLSLDTSAPLWSAILTEISQGLPIADFVQPNDLETAEVDAFTGFKPGPFTRVTVEELFLPGTVPSEEETSRVGVQIDEASGLLWQEGCVGPQVARGFFNLSQVEASYENWQQANADWGARAAQGSGVRGGPENTRTSFFYNNSFAPFGRTWGAPFAPTELCPIPEPPPPVLCDPFVGPCEPVLMPDLRCLDLTSATQVLNGLGLVVGEVRERGGNRGDGDLVVEETRPGIGDLLPQGTAVELTLRNRDRVNACGGDGGDDGDD